MRREVTLIARLCCVLGCFLTAAAAAGAEGKDAGTKGTKVPANVGVRIVGTWQAQPDKGLTITFRRDGSLQMARKSGKARVTVDGRYKLLDGQNMKFTFTDPKGSGRKFTNAVRVKSLSDEELVLVYRGKFKGTDKEEAFRRVK
jgi:uncharacterized protein (TIGR03066 family)